jgi:hypothetical protein
MSSNNPLTAPSGPSPWGQRGGDVVPAGTPRIRNALVVPRARVMPPVPAVPPRPMPMPVPDEEHISPRVPVPKADFPEEQHKELHEKTMGEAFDEPGAAQWVKRVYPVVRHYRPDVDPRHVLETVHDAYFAVKHGFMTNPQAGAMVGTMAHRRHREELARRAAETLRRENDVEPDTQ